MINNMIYFLGVVFLGVSFTTTLASFSIMIEVLGAGCRSLGPSRLGVVSFLCNVYELILHVSLGFCQGLYQGLGGDLHLRTLALALVQEDIGITSQHR